MSCENQANYYQGDQYSLIFKINQGDGPLNLEGVTLIEFTIGCLTKTWPEQVTYNENTKEFYFPVTQKETFAMNKYEQYQVRIKNSLGNVFASQVSKIYIKETLSKNII